MDPKPQRSKGRDGVRSALSVAIEGLAVAENIISVEPAKITLGIVRGLLVRIKDSMANRTDCVELGLDCARVCKVLERGMRGRRADEFGLSVFEAIEELTTAVMEMEMDVVKLDKRGALFGIFSSKSDGEKIAAWRKRLNEILQLFDTELAMHTHGNFSDIRHNVADTKSIVFDTHRIVQRLEGVDGRNSSSRHRPSGELPPPPPTACFGRDDLINKIIGFVENLNKIALIGTGGIGKTSISLEVLHNGRIKKRFGDNRRFIRCDQFQPSRAYFLTRLSKAIGAGVENPEPCHYIPHHHRSSKLPNSHNPDAFKTGYTPRVLSHIQRRRAVRFGRRYLEATRFPSVTLLATVAHQNRWDNDRLAKEWRQRRTSVLRTEHQTSLAAAIELSLASPLFRVLGPGARELLGVIAFYPQGVNEKNFHWLFPTIPNVTQAFDTFTILSLTYRSNGFITMLAPLRGHLRPKDRNLPPLLRITKDCYFARMPANLNPSDPRVNDARWIVEEDVNVEHLLDVLTSVGPDSDDIWEACINFMRHLYLLKPRKIVLGPKIEALPDNHRYKPRCLFDLAMLFGSVGNHTEQRRLLDHALKLERERGNDDRVALALVLEMLSNASRMLGLHREGIRQSKKALKIYKQLGDTIARARCLIGLAQLLCREGQLDAAEEAALLSIELLPERGEEFKVCQCHITLGKVYDYKGQREKAIRHYEVALRIASNPNWHNILFEAYLSLADIFLADNEFDGAYSHITQARSHTLDNSYELGRAADLHAKILYRQRRFEEAMSQILHALEIFENLGASSSVESSRANLWSIEEAIRSTAPSVDQVLARTVHHHNRNHTSG